MIERTDVRSPFSFSLLDGDDSFYKEKSSLDEVDYYWTRPHHQPIQISIPRLVLELTTDILQKNIESKLFNILDPHYIKECLYSTSMKTISSLYSVIPFSDVSISEFEKLREFPYCYSLWLHFRFKLYSYILENDLM